MSGVSFDLVAKARELRLQQIKNGKVTPNRLADNARRLRLRKEFEAERLATKETVS